MSHPTPPLSAGYQGEDDDLTDVFHGLSLKDPPGIGYRRTSSMMSSMGVAARRSSAPTQSGGPMMNWPSSISEEEPFVPQIGGGGATSSKLIGMWSSNSAQPPTSAQSSQGGGAPGSIWSPTFGSRPESELSSYQDSDSSNNGFSPIYSPVTTNGIFDSTLLNNGGSRNGGLSFHSSSITSSAGTHNNIMVRECTCTCICIHTFVLVHVAEHVCTCTYNLVFFQLLSLIFILSFPNSLKVPVILKSHSPCVTITMCCKNYSSLLCNYKIKP